MRRLAASLLALLLLPTAAAAQGADAEGQQLYDKYCAQCHGATGAGDGVATPHVKPAPRDFTSGKFKFRTTPSGTMPTDADIKRSIRLGLAYTSMPAWPQFSEAQLDALVEHVKSFSAGFQDADKIQAPITIPEPPASSEESVQRGRTVYEQQGCAACHGNLGRGDGRSAPTLKDDWGHHIRPADMTMRWTFRAGPTRKDIFRTFSTGLNGTPMPSYADTLPEADRWDLVNYITSLGSGDGPDYANLLIAAAVDEPLDLGNEQLFDAARPARFPLVGQIMQQGRDFFPSTSSIVVQAVYNRDQIAFRVRWNDMRAETEGKNSPALAVPPFDEDQPAAAAAGDESEEGDFWGTGAAEEPAGDDFWGGGEEGGAETAAAGGDQEFSDAVALQFPAQLPTGPRKPYFLFGDSTHPVDLWFVDLARDFVEQFKGSGSDNLEPTRGDDFEMTRAYADGEWTLLIKRDLRSTAGISFAPSQMTPIAFSVWDGFNRERGNKRALSAWFHVYTAPAEVASATVPMIRAALIVLLVEILIVLAVRRGRRERPAAAGGVSRAQTAS